jgi:hypothetical protein
LACLLSRGSPSTCAWLATSWRQRAPSWNACGRHMPPATVPGTRCRPFPVVTSFGRLAFVLSCLFFLPFVCRYLETPGFQCLYALKPSVAILSTTRIHVGHGSHTARCAFAQIPNCSKLRVQHLGSHVESPGLGRAQSEMAMTTYSPGAGVAPFPPGSPSGFCPLERAPEVMKFFIMMQSLNLCLMRYE